MYPTYIQSTSSVLNNGCNNDVPSVLDGHAAISHK